MNVTPFFVADRPMSLRIIKGLPLQEYPGVQIGIMAHANTTQNFQEAFNKYPCENEEFCDAVKGPCAHRNDHNNCSARGHILSSTIKMCDSGIFTREGATLTYKRLFEAYQRMGVEYGVMIDVFRDSKKTLEKAKEALQEYEPFRGKFRLVAVAQGKTTNEYIQSYEDLKTLGFSYIAIGGLLRKVENSARYTQVRDEESMYKVLQILRMKYPKDWLFALGCFSPSRLDRFNELGVWGDYKGWIFQYKKRNETLDALLDAFLSKHISLIHDDSSEEVARTKEDLKRNLAVRSEISLNNKVALKHLFRGRQETKVPLNGLNQEVDLKELETGHPPEKYELEETQNNSDIAQESRKLKKQIEANEQQLNKINVYLAEEISALLSFIPLLPEETKTLCTRIKEVIDSTEREYRFSQVQDKMAEVILAPIQSTIPMPLVTCSNNG